MEHSYKIHNANHKTQLWLTVGPATGPKIIPIDHILIAKPCFSRGYVSNIMVCEIGSNGAETKPCNILNNTNSVSVLMCQRAMRLQ